MPFEKRLWVNLEQRAKYAPSVTIYLILLHKGFKSTSRGIHIQQFTDISLCVFLKTKQKSQFELTVGGI